MEARQREKRFGQLGGILSGRKEVGAKLTKRFPKIVLLGATPAARVRCTVHEPRRHGKKSAHDRGSEPASAKWHLDQSYKVTVTKSK